MIKFIDEGKINQNLASKQLFPLLLSSSRDDINSVLEEIVGSEETDKNLEQIIIDLFNRFPDEAEMLKKGKKKLIGMFMGQIMKETQGKADPKKVQKILMRTLDK